MECVGETATDRRMDGQVDGQTNRHTQGFDFGSVFLMDALSQMDCRSLWLEWPDCERSYLGLVPLPQVASPVQC